MKKIYLVLLVFLSSCILLLEEPKEEGNMVLWAANVRNKSFHDRILALKMGEFDEMSVFPIDIKSWEDSGKSINELNKKLGESRAVIGILDPYTSWVPNWQIPDYFSSEDSAFVNFSEDEIFRMADSLGVHTINIIETFGVKYSVTEFASAATKVADRAAKHDLKVSLEFMPFSGIPDLKTAWQIVKLADKENLGLTFDTWHYYRGNPNNELLKDIPGDKIFAIQFADATLELKGDDLLDDLLHYRLLLGEGEFPLVEVGKILESNNAMRSVGIELFSDSLDSLSGRTVGNLTGNSLRHFINSITK